MPRQRKWAQREHPNERFRKGAGGGAETGADLVLLILHEDHRLMTFETGG
jgi:hypothetical protein